jgi:UDP-N-acetylmuramoylalanine--D-glutamate ligase
VTLITEVLNVGGRSAIACGNLGTPFSSVISRLTPSSIAVVEVSSFQLLWCDQLRPEIGVLLNLGTNHLDRHVDQQAYIAAKARLFRRQTPTDWAVLNGSDTRIVALSEHCHAQHVWFGENRSNPPSMRLAPETLQALTESAQAVLQVGRLFGIPDPLAAQAIRSFRGLEHRMEHVTTTPHGVHVVNDSKSTTPDSLRFALAEIPGDVVVIIGGREKGLDFSQLVEPLHAKRVKGIVLIGESRSGLRGLLNGATTPTAPSTRPANGGTRSGRGARAEASRTTMHESDTLEEAVRIADGLARPGTTLLFSPACASFDMFRDFEDRGRTFKEIVTHLPDPGSRVTDHGSRITVHSSR